MSQKYMQKEKKTGTPSFVVSPHPNNTSQTPTSAPLHSQIPASKLGNPSGPIGAMGRLGAVTCKAGCVCTARGKSNGAVGEG